LPTGSNILEWARFEGLASLNILNVNGHGRLVWQGSKEINAGIHHPRLALIRGEVIDLSLAEDVQVGVQNVNALLVAKLHEVSILPWAGRGKCWTPIPSKIRLFFSDIPTVRELEDLLRTIGPF
jgi:hypothetical protein